MGRDCADTFKLAANRSCDLTPVIYFLFYFLRFEYGVMVEGTAITGDAFLGVLIVVE